MSKQVFLTSGTGYIGAAVAQAFKKKGYEVSALARSDKAAEQLQKAGVKPVRGDIKEAQTYTEAVRNADIVIHTAATNDADYAKYDGLAVDTVLKTFEGTKKTFIYTSGVWVLGNTGEKPADENTAYNPINLVTWRPEHEKRVLNAAKAGLKTIVIRPGIVYGNERGILAQFIDNARTEKQATFVGNGENTWAPIHVEDLADLYLLAAEKVQPGALYHATDDAPVKTRELAEWVATAASVPGKVQGLSQDEAAKKFGPYAEGFAVNQKIDSSKARKELGWQPKHKSLKDYLAQYKVPAAAR